METKNQFTFKPDKKLHPNIVKQLRNMHFRQSFIGDYLSCPKMSLYRWILQLEEEQPFMAAFFGTAGHSCIYEMHKQRRYDWTQLELLDIFEKSFFEELEKSPNMPKVASAYDTIQDQFDALAPWYVNLVLGYQDKDENRQFLSTIHEQLFVLEVEVEGKKYVFTGQIDQAGYYEDGTFALRDIKFRDNAFRPTKITGSLDIQMTVYAAALKYGKPSCPACRPVVSVDPGNAGSSLQYNGPCKECEAKIGTTAWPNKFAGRCQWIWMRDFDRRKKDQFARRIKDPNKVKELNVKSGRLAIREIFNPKWADGYKKGDYAGPGLISTSRTPSSLDVFMSDIIAICDNIKQGVFYRNPGDKCKFWCRYPEQCIRGVEMDIEELDAENATNYGTIDPFGSD